MTKEDSKLIKDAFRLVLTEETTAIDETIASSPIPSENLYQRCDEKAREIIDDQKKILPTRKILTILIAATLIISLFAVVAYAARDKIGGFFVDFFEKYAKLSTDEIDKTQTKLSDISITYIPSGYIKSREKLLNSSSLYEWSKNDNLISLHIAPLNNTSHTIDTENSNYITTEVGDLTVFRTEKHGDISATWTDEKMVYTLSSTSVEWDEMVKIIEGIKVEE